MGGSGRPPSPPFARHAPAKPGRVSTTRSVFGGLRTPPSSPGGSIGGAGGGGGGRGGCGGGGGAARRALLAAGLGWLFDGYETYALILVGAPAIRDLVAVDRLGQLPLYFGGLTSVTLLGWATGGLAFGVLADYLGGRRTAVASI